MLSPPIYPRKNSERRHLLHGLDLQTSRMVSLGPVEMETVEKVEVKITDEEKARQQRISARPSLSKILNLHDFEVFLSLGIDFNTHVDSGATKAIAKQVMAEKAWAYYSSAADDEITNRENHAAYHRFEPLVCC